MQPIDLDPEIKYLKAFHTQKRLQKLGSSKELSKLQKKVTKYGKKYAESLIHKIIKEPAVVRKYATGEKYVLEIITATGQIVIYSHPQNSAVKPKLEVHHPKYGFIGWWNEGEFDMEYEGVEVWETLCKGYNFNPSDPSEVIKEAEYIERLCKM